MKRYLKLVNFEFNRFLKLYLILVGSTILLQIIGVVFESQKHLNRANELINEEFLTVKEVIERLGTVSLYNISQSGWFMAPVAICGVTLIIYVFFIWYRDWLGKNTFSYRLLMLPTARINIYLAKATTILLFVLGIVALQLVLMPFESQILKWIVPSDFRTDLTVTEMTNTIYYFSILFPKNFMEFILYYGSGMAAVCIVFTAILFERSFRLKGIFYAILYCGISILIFLAPILVDAFFLKNYFYPLELFFMELVTGIIVLAGAIWMGNFLIKNKVRV